MPADRSALSGLIDVLVGIGAGLVVVVLLVVVAVAVEASTWDGGDDD